MKYINTCVNQNSKHTDILYTYATERDLKVGQKVKVSFVTQKKLTDAYVVETDVKLEFDPKKIKLIAEVDEDICLNEEMIETVVWMRQRYGIKYLDGIRCFAPVGKKAKENSEKEPYKDILKNKDIDRENAMPKVLTEEQRAALEKISKSIEEDKHDCFLVHGITGSGKTELYMHAINKALSHGKNAIMLVPEISLTKQMIERFAIKFGKENIAVIHSKLTIRERFDEWMRIRDGRAKIVIGARSAVFSPLENIGIIILDEEHEGTYKADQVPKYETVDIAIKRLMHYKGVLLLGSATPSIVSYQRAKDGIYKLIEMKKRYNNNLLPEVELVDMHEEIQGGNTSFMSGKLYNKITANLQDGKQVILFLNRRGYSTTVLCPTCKEVQKCEDCGISLTYHKRGNYMQCHYCGKKTEVLETCPKCQTKLVYMGDGTQKIEEKIADFFPEAKIDRFDIDTAKNKKEIDRILTNFEKKKTDILVGTQLVAKGLDFKNVGLVGVIMADTSLNIPDYRSSERTFQLVTQVAGRAGRGEEQGEVIVQTYSPENYALLAAKDHDYSAFFEEEIFVRKSLRYPPFSDIIVALFTSQSEKAARDMAKQARDFLLRADKDFDETQIFEPMISESFISKDSFRYYLMIKSPKILRNKYVYYLSKLSEKLIQKDFWIKVEGKNKKVKCDLTIDVNPFSIN